MHLCYLLHATLKIFNNFCSVFARIRMFVRESVFQFQLRRWQQTQSSTYIISPRTSCSFDLNMICKISHVSHKKVKCKEKEIQNTPSLKAAITIFNPFRLATTVRIKQFLISYWHDFLLYHFKEIRTYTA